MTSSADPDFELFLADPHAFLLKYQNVITTIVRLYVKWGMFKEHETADLIQTVNLGLLERVENIRENYNHSTLLKTYISAIVRNICLRQWQKDTKRALAMRKLEGGERDISEQVDRHSIEQSRILFSAVVKQFGRRAPKLMICLKLRFRQPVTRSDIMAWWPGCRRADVRKFLEKFGENFEKMTDLEVCAAATPYFNAAEQKVNTNDALRKWTAMRIEEMLQALNGAIPGAAFNEESLKVLFEDSISPFILQG
jgi:DNA-directed RNA polymerase specialized sigma24 family protein